jgi:hypothetical protein
VTYARGREKNMCSMAHVGSCWKQVHFRGSTTINLETIKFPASVADLNAGLPNVDANHLSHVDVLAESSVGREKV